MNADEQEILAWGLGGIWCAVAIAAAFLRKKPWVMALWIPATVFVAGVFLDGIRTAALLLGVGGERNPFASLLIAGIVLPVMGYALAGLVFCYLIRPRKHAWRSTTVASGLLVCVVLALAWKRGNEAKFQVQLLDDGGKALAGMPVQVRIPKEGEERIRNLTSDETGKLRIRIDRGQWADLVIGPDHPSHPLHKARILAYSRFRARYEIQQSWIRKPGGRRIEGSFSTVTPFRWNIPLTLVVCSSDELASATRRDQIRAAIAALRQAPSNRIQLGDCCRNLESVGLIPELMEIHAKEPAERPQVLMGIAEATFFLMEIDRVCVELLGRAPNVGPRENDDFLKTVTTLCQWAGATQEAGTDPATSLRQVRDRLATQARELLEFSMTALSNGENPLRILFALGPHAKPAVPRIVNHLLVNPPPAGTPGGPSLSVLWRDVLERIGADAADLQPLVRSDNPLLRECVKDAAIPSPRNR